MEKFKAIEKILDDNFDQEWDSWYYGPCDQIAAIAKDFTDKQWDEFIDFTKQQKPDDWRVMLSHAFIEKHYGKSKALVVFQVVKCKGYYESYCSLQYLQDLNGVPAWLKSTLQSKLESMLSESKGHDKVLLNNMLSLCTGNM